MRGSPFDDFIERLAAALGGEEGRDDFAEYLHEMTPEGCADQPETGGPLKGKTGSGA